MKNVLIVIIILMLIFGIVGYVIILIMKKILKILELKLKIEKNDTILSLNGFAGFSAAINFFTSARMAVDEASPPPSVFTWLEKKYFSSKIPRGLCRYFCVVTREMVDSCISTA